MTLIKKQYFTINEQMIGYDDGIQKDFLTDALGSVTAEVDQMCSKAFEGRYKPFGETLTSSGIKCNFGWVGIWGYRETNLSHTGHYVRARHYSQGCGNWTSTDPIWPAEMAYQYVSGRVMLFDDPSGMKCKITTDPKLNTLGCIKCSAKCTPIICPPSICSGFSQFAVSLIHKEDNCSDCRIYQWYSDYRNPGVWVRDIKGGWPKPWMNPFTDVPDDSYTRLGCASFTLIDNFRTCICCNGDSMCWDWTTVLSAINCTDAVCTPRVGKGVYVTTIESSKAAAQCKKARNGTDP